MNTYINGKNDERLLTFECLGLLTTWRELEFFPCKFGWARSSAVCGELPPLSVPFPKLLYNKIPVPMAASVTPTPIATGGDIHAMAPNDWRNENKPLAPPPYTTDWM